MGATLEGEIIYPEDGLLTFDDLEIESDERVGPMAKKATIMFENGWGASITQSAKSYGGKSKLWQVALIDEDEEIRTDTHLTDDVWGWCDEDEVTRILKLIQTEL